MFLAEFCDKLPVECVVEVVQVSEFISLRLIINYNPSWKAHIANLKKRIKHDRKEVSLLTKRTSRKSFNGSKSCFGAELTA